jgi:hypothetical protein
MKKFWRGFRKASDQHEREERTKRRAEVLERVRMLMLTGGHDAENEFREMMKEIKPAISNQEMAERVRQFHDAVSARQLRDQGRL